MKMLLRYALLLIGALLCADTVFFLVRTSGHLGIWLPGLMGLPLLLMGVFYSPVCTFFASGRLGHVLHILVLAAYACAVLFFGLISLFLYVNGNRRADFGADALIVLGCHLYGERPSLTLTRRLDAAIVYLQNSPDTICFVSGGQGENETIPEALAMQRYLTAHGIDQARIVIEDKSESSYENFRFTAPLIQDRCGKDASVVFTTTVFHTYRCARIAKQAGLQAEGYSAKGVWYITFNDYLRECVALTVYALTGRL